MNASYQTCFAVFITAFLAGLAPSPVLADEPAPIVLKAEPGTRVILNCQTNAIGMDFQPFKTTAGTLTLELTFNPSSNDPQTGATATTPDVNELGTWTPSVKPGEHAASLGVNAQKTCADGCTLRQTPSGNMELWAPRPVMPSKLEKEATLTLATLDVKSLELKASVLRHKQLSILEKGQCQIVAPQTDNQPPRDPKTEADANPDPTTTPEPSSKPQPAAKP